MRRRMLTVVSIQVGIGRVPVEHDERAQVDHDDAGDVREVRLQRPRVPEEAHL
jgi:hypothetical protein